MADNGPGSLEVTVTTHSEVLGKRDFPATCVSHSQCVERMRFKVTAHLNGGEIKLNMHLVRCISAQ